MGLSSECASVYSATNLVSGLQVRTTFKTATSGLTVTYVSVYTNNSGTGLSWPPPAASINPQSGICENAMTAMRWTVVHNGQGTITDVHVIVTLGSVTAQTDGSATLKQTYEITFETSITATVKPLRSGNIGYTPGSPVLGGQAT